ncbi:LamG-like jellyroll fold domain-containing protein, partial [Singulisphaera rosea]
RDASGGHLARPELYEGHSVIVAEGPGRVARIRGLGGIACGSAGDFEANEPFSAGGWYNWMPWRNEVFLSKMYPSGPHRGYELSYDGERFEVLLIHDWDRDPKIAIDVQTTPSHLTGWHHIFMTYDGSAKASGVKIYVDGEPQADLLKHIDNLSHSIRVRQPFVIGSRLTGTTMQGRASHVRVIPRLLTDDEVRALSKLDKPDGSS